MIFIGECLEILMLMLSLCVPLCTNHLLNSADLITQQVASPSFTSSWTKWIRQLNLCKADWRPTPSQSIWWIIWIFQILGRCMYVYLLVYLRKQLKIYTMSVWKGSPASSANARWKLVSYYVFKEGILGKRCGTQILCLLNLFSTQGAYWLNTSTPRFNRMLVLFVLLKTLRSFKSFFNILDSLVNS